MIYISSSRGILYCDTCGMKGISKLHSLSGQCNPLTTYGIAAKITLAQDELTPHLTTWPDAPILKKEENGKQMLRSKTRGLKRRGIPYLGVPICFQPVSVENAPPARGASGRTYCAVWLH